jgi:hypothetical protein
MRDEVVSLGAVDEAEKAWLYAHCAAVVYPSSYEGFGLIPFEAAAFGKACFFAPQTSLTEMLPADTALITPWDPVRSAEAIIGVLRDRTRAAQLIARIAEAGSSLTWARTADGLLDAYDYAVRLPDRDLLRIAGDQLTVDARYWGFRHAVGPTGLALVDPRQPLLPRDVQRAVAALARRSATRGPLLAALRTAYRLGKRSGRDNGLQAPEDGQSDDE